MVRSCKLWCLEALFFEEEGKAVLVTSDRYVHMLRGFLKTKSKELRNETEVYFQQDGPIAHTARKTMDVLMEMFSSHVIFLRGDVMWPASSPELCPSDYFLWGCLKAEVYKDRQTSIDGIKAARNIARNDRRVMDNFRNCLQQCITFRGCHLEDPVLQ